MFWRRKRPKRWKTRYSPSWYTTPQLERFLEGVDERISKRAQPLHEDIAQAARLANEIARRRSSITRDIA